MADSPASLPQALIQRFILYLAELHLELAALEVHLTTNCMSEDVRESFSSLAHRLAGTAETYGFAAVGERARALEKAVADQIGSPAELTGFVTGLRESLEEAIAREPN